MAGIRSIRNHGIGFAEYFRRHVEADASVSARGPVQAGCPQRYQAVNRIRPLRGQRQTEVERIRRIRKKGCESHPLPPAPAAGQAYVPLTSIACHNTTMAEFVSQLKGEPGGDTLRILPWTPQVLKARGLRIQIDGQDAFHDVNRSEGVTLADAIENQLGLKLEERKRNPSRHPRNRR